MFRGLIKDAETAAGSVVAKYAARALVGMPFLVALGFGTAGLAIMLVEQFGHRDAYLILAGGYAALGLLASLIVRTREVEQVVAEENVGAAAPSSAGADPAAVADATRMPLGLLGAWVGLLFWPASTDEPAADAAGGNSEGPEPSGAAGTDRESTLDEAA